MTLPAYRYVEMDRQHPARDLQPNGPAHNLKRSHHLVCRSALGQRIGNLARRTPRPLIPTLASRESEKECPESDQWKTGIHAPECSTRYPLTLPYICPNKKVGLSPLPATAP